MFSSTIVSLALAASVLANVFITNPVATSVLTGGQPATVYWQDDGNKPSLAQFGNATFAVYVGNAIQQTPLQTIASVDVSAVSSFDFTPDPTMGPDSNEYFIRATSQSFMNPSSPQYPEEAFSAKFTLTGMSGTFNSSVQAEIDGQSTAPIGGPTSASAAPATASGKITTTTVVSASKSTSSASSSVSATSSAAAGSTNGAGKPVIATGFVALVAALVGASIF